MMGDGTVSASHAASRTQVGPEAKAAESKTSLYP